MNSNTELARMVASWVQHPDPDLIRHALTTRNDRHSLATLCADADLDLPDDITELVLALIETDPLADRILDVLFAAALNNIPTTDADLEPLTTAIRERPDSQAFQRLLAMSLTDLLFDDDAAAPEHLRERLAEAAAALGATLPAPEFAPVFLAHAASSPDTKTQTRTMHLCWERAASLPDDLRYEISLELADLCDVEDDPHLALDVARTALQLLPSFGPPDPGPEDTVYLHVLTAEALAATAGRPAAITYTAEAFILDPRLERSPLTESWTWNLAGHIWALGLDDVPPSLVLPHADQLADHHDRWPSDPNTQASLAALLARAYLTTNAPARARPWVDLAVTHVAAVPDLAGEVAMLQVQVAFQEGRTEELDPLLRQAAPLLQGPDLEEHRLIWAMIVEAVSRVRRDPDLVRLAELWLGRTIGALTDVTGGHAPEHLRDGLGFSRRLLTIHEQFLAGDRDERIRLQVLTLCEEIPDDHPQLIAAAHVYACALETGRGDSVEALKHLDQVTAVIKRLREDPPGGFPLVHLEQIERLYRLLLPDSTDAGSGRIPELERLRQENEAAGRSDFAYMLTRGLMGIHAANNQPEAVVEEGTRALLFHTRRSSLIPDARERAALRGDLSTLAEEVFRATLKLNRTELAAELLEIVRAQPVPLARDDVPDPERPLLGLLSKLIDNPTPISTRWTGPWLTGPQTPNAAGADSPEVDRPEDTALILTGLPTILMPWGPALNDLLRDPQAVAVARLTVPRTETG